MIKSQIPVQVQEFYSIGDNFLFIEGRTLHGNFVVQHFLKAVAKSPRMLKRVVSQDQGILVENLVPVVKRHFGIKNSRAIETVARGVFDIRRKDFVIINAEVGTFRAIVQQADRSTISHPFMGHSSTEE